MRGHRPTLVRGVARRLAAAIFLLVAASDAAQAQRPGPGAGAPPPGSADPKLATRERQQRETMLRSAEILTAEGKTDQRRVEAAVEQVKQDFKRIQVLRNELVRSILGGGPLDYKIISDKTGEINKRAHRLKAHLVPQTHGGDEKDQKSQDELSGGQMQDALVTLCKRIESFVENPVFKVPGVVDVQESARAGSDLQSIIRLSGGIKRGAERLSKTHKK